MSQANLMGYYVQQGQGQGTGGGTPSAPSNILIPAAGYPGSVELGPLDLQKTGFVDERLCYIGYSSAEEPRLSGRINAYYGPYLFSVGMVEIPPVDGWDTYIGSWVDAEGVTHTGAPENAEPVHCNFVYCVVGEPAAGATWYTTLPANGFCANNNQGYAWDTPFSLKSYTASWILNNAKVVRTGAQWKFNGRWSATGGGSGTAAVNIGKQLKQYNGFRSWATGWLYPGRSSYRYILDQYPMNYYPSAAVEPFAAYDRTNIIAAPEFWHYGSSDIVIPSVRTDDITGAVATASTVDFEENLLTGRLYVDACAKPGSGLNTPMQIEGLFPGYRYPTLGAQMWLPSFSCGFVFTSEAVTIE